MALKKIQSKTGKAQMVKSGHTANGRFGANPDARVKGNNTPRDLKVK